MAQAKKSKPPDVVRSSDGNGGPASSFNLVDEKWIPVAASQERISLREVFSNSSVQKLSGNPVDKIVVFRFLLSIVQASNDLPDLDAWLDLTTETMAANALAYLDKWHDRFDLFGEKPFLQFPQLDGKGAVSSLGSLQVEISTGNKVVLTDWNLQHDLDLPQLAVLLLRSACYACGGKKYDNTVLLSPSHTKKRAGKNGTLLGFAGYLHSYLFADTLLDSLRFNLLTDDDIKEINVFPMGKGIPFWENMPKGEIDSRAESYKKSYLGQLFPIDKFLLLHGNQIVMTDGIVYPGHKEGLVDPAVRIVKDKAVWANTDKHPWRELPALLAFLEADAGSVLSPFFLCSGLTKIREAAGKEVTVWVGGLSVSSNAGEQYVSGKDGYVESEFSFSSEYMQGKNYLRFKNYMQDLDEESKNLYTSVQGYFKRMNIDPDPAGKFAGAATTRFWDEMSGHAQDAIDFTFSGASDEQYNADLAERKKMWHRLVLDLYSAACPRDTPRQLEAWVECSPRFTTTKSRKEKK